MGRDTFSTVKSKGLHNIDQDTGCNSHFPGCKSRQHNWCMLSLRCMSGRAWHKPHTDRLWDRTLTNIQSGTILS